MRRRSWKAAVLALALAILVGAALLAAQSLSAGAEHVSGDVARGQYLTSIMDCAGCHTPGALAGKPDASRRFAGSDIGFALGSGPTAGVVYPPNLTPDRETGLGAWTEDEMIRAIRGGQSRDGRPLVPIMPWPNYSALTMADARALVAYLRSLQPIAPLAFFRVAVVGVQPDAGARLQAVGCCRGAGQRQDDGERGQCECAKSH